MRLRPLLAALLAIVVWAPAHAAQYPAWGDTGWCCYSKRDCCAEAIALANDASGRNCQTAGGMPRPFSGSQRGSCNWEWTTDTDGSTIYRCVSEAAVWCR